MPRSSPLLASLIVALAGACGAYEPGAPEAASQPLSQGSERSPTACGAELPGPVLAPGAVEGDPVLAELLSTIDVSRAPNPTGLGGDNSVSRAVASYMLGRSGAASVTHVDALARGGLGRSVLAAAVNGGGMIDLKLLRSGLFRYYLCESTIPRSLSELVARYGDYTTWDTFEIPCSRAKDGPRRIHENHERGTYVAETIVNGEVRETEVIFTDLRADGQLDFAAYTDRGELTNRSTFATGGGSIHLAAPFACMTCHFDRTSGSFSVTMPLGTGAGCQHP